MIKGGFCNAHDSAAVRIYLQHALVYANNRSIRDGFQPVYRFEECDALSYGNDFKKDGSFWVENASFFDDTTSRCVHINKDADGYRLPYYDEWMALARAGESYRSLIWGWGEDSTTASQYAWFGVRDPEDMYSKMDPDDYSDRNWLESSCGERLQKSRPVGMLKPNAYGLYDMFGLVCENVILQRNVTDHVQTTSCKGGFLTDSLKALNFDEKCSDFDRMKTFQGLRLVRQIK
jgi:formylglycine-generating enzyme